MFLDKAYAEGDAYVRNAILVSFVEDLTSAPTLLDRLGPNLKLEAESCFPDHGWT